MAARITDEEWDKLSAHIVAAANQRLDTLGKARAATPGEVATARGKLTMLSAFPAVTVFSRASRGAPVQCRRRRVRPAPPAPPRTRSAVPTGTVLRSTITSSSVMCSPMLRAATHTYWRSAEPSSSGGVPPPLNCSAPCGTATTISVVNDNRPSAELRWTICSRSGAWIRMPPPLRIASLPWYTSRPTVIR